MWDFRTSLSIFHGTVGTFRFYSVKYCRLFFPSH
ncbi:unnamed protein product [Spirodela intermedia]|uniref:Uncharacterized protein n=1 Tax=Spirodela intermedia TaxID=51605 RepID=A0A7I8KG29_SPIIN|nr:unnamed protein product [Spirodela intermedia]